MNQQQIYLLFADLLEYPTPSLPQQVGSCSDLLADYQQLAVKMGEFLKFVENTPISRVEEIYTSTFDINPTCCPYAGYQLFGENYKRGEFLVKLKEKYRERGFSESNELADHLTVLLRFMATLSPGEILARELIEDCLMPTLQKLTTSFTKENPYAPVLQALLEFLEQTSLCSSTVT